MSTDTGRLPKRAKQKINEITDAEASAQASLRATDERIAGIFKQLRLKSREDATRDEHEEIERLQALKGQQQRRRDELLNGVTKIRQFLMALPASAELEDTPREKVQLRKGESLPDAVKRVRDDIRSAQSEIRKLHLAAPRAADLKRAAKNYVNDLVEKGRPKINASHDEFKVLFDNGDSTAVTHIRATLAWLAPEIMLKRLEDEIDAMPVPEFALSTKEKSERLAVAKTKLLTLEREEEAVIEKMLNDGLHIDRRFDADPQAILGVQIKREKAVAA